MLLENKTAIIYGAGGAIGGAVARTFAREGAKVFLSGRTLSKVQRVADEIVAAGGTAEAFQVDALDEAAIRRRRQGGRAGGRDLQWHHGRPATGYPGHSYR